jgi:UPF0716 protein FxsA
MMVLLLLIGLPALEIWTLAQVGSRLGWVDTLVVLVLVGVLGAALARNEGLRVVERMRGALAEGRMPEREIVDGLLVLAAGALLVLPGFVSDVLGLLLLFPLTRPLFRGWLARKLRGRMIRRGPPPGWPPGPPAPPGSEPPTSDRPARPTVIVLPPDGR